MVHCCCQFKNIFGKVGEGVHAYRILNIAIVDVLFTILAAWFIYWKFFPIYSFLFILICLFFLGIVAHRVFCVRTSIDKFLFPIQG